MGNVIDVNSVNGAKYLEACDTDMLMAKVCKREEGFEYGMYVDYLSSLVSDCGHTPRPISESDYAKVTV